MTFRVPGDKARSEPVVASPLSTVITRSDLHGRVEKDDGDLRITSGLSPSAPARSRSDRRYAEHKRDYPARIGVYWR